MVQYGGVWYTSRVGYGTARYGAVGGAECRGCLTLAVLVSCVHIFGAILVRFFVLVLSLVLFYSPQTVPCCTLPHRAVLYHTVSRYVFLFNSSNTYKTPPVVRVSPPDSPTGVQAEAKAVLDKRTGILSSIEITNPGSGYSSTLAPVAVEVRGRVNRCRAPSQPTAATYFEVSAVRFFFLIIIILVLVLVLIFFSHSWA